MARKTEIKKLITIETAGPLSELGGISGPIINPCYVELTKIVRLVNGHKKVYEVNPNNHDDKILLTLRNVREENFKKEVKEQKVKPIDPKPVEKAGKKETPKTETSPSGDFTKK